MSFLAGDARQRDAHAINGAVADQGTARARLSLKEAMKAILGVGVALLFLSACSGEGDKCVEPQCPVNEVFVGSTDGSHVTGAQATLAGPVSATLNCREDGCLVPDDFTTPGAYTLTVSAPGYETQTVQVTVTYTAPNTPCACPGAHLSGDPVVLSPAP